MPEEQNVKNLYWLLLLVDSKQRLEDRLEDFLSKKHRLICRFQRKCLQIPNKKLILAATNPTTPLNDAYHGGTSLFI